MQNLSASKNWRMQKQRSKLGGSYCSKCKNNYYPERSYCPFCQTAENIKQVILPSKGKIVSWSMIYAAPSGFEEAVPYPIALVKIDNGPVILSQITDFNLKDLKIGTRVEAVLRKYLVSGSSGIIRYGIKFRPLNW